MSFLRGLGTEISKVFTSCSHNQVRTRNSIHRKFKKTILFALTLFSYIFLAPLDKTLSGCLSVFRSVVCTHLYLLIAQLPQIFNNRGHDLHSSSCIVNSDIHDVVFNTKKFLIYTTFYSSFFSLLHVRC